MVYYLNFITRHSRTAGGGGGETNDVNALLDIDLDQQWDKFDDSEVGYF